MLGLFELNESSLSSMSLEYNSELTRDVLDYGSKPEELDWHEKENDVLGEYL